ncbi:hypothetical protein GF373_16900, partial [bacterium]|nr:hypothetical protein [bacterium]
MMRPDDNKILFNLKTIYLVFFLAIILFITLAMAYKIHQDLYGEIEEGFNQKLTAISTVLANFIDGDIHQSLLEPHDIRELAYIQMEDAIYSVDRSTQKLVRIDPENGLLEEIAEISRSHISSLAYDAETDRLYGIDIQSTTPQLSLIDRQTGQVEPVASLGQSMDSFTVRSADSLFFSQNSTIASFHIPTATHSVMGETERESTNGLAYDTAAETLFYLDREDHHVVSRPLANKENLSRFPLQAISASVEPVSNTQEETTYASIPFPLTDEDMRQAMQFERIRFSGDPAWIQSCRENVIQIAKTIARQIGSLDKTRLPSLTEAHLEGLAWDPSRKRLYSDLGMLVSINPQTGEYWKQGWWDGYRSQVDPRYLDIVMPMRRIKSKLNITYLYTFTHPQGGSPDDLAYVLDASMN